MATTPRPSTRTVRIFLSSTFRDFAEERDLLVQRVFPSLRRRLADRFVELVDVDLRWGITAEQAERGEVLPICLAEIDRSRPYFVGLLGERYGWIPSADAYPPAVLETQPWLAEHLGGKSVTELEILHGVLNNPAMAGRALFYFRSPAWSQAKGGDYVPASEDDARRIAELKDRIRASGFPVVEDYADPEALAQRLEADLWEAIDQAYPADEVPDAFERESLRHEAYAVPRRALYLGGEALIASLDAALSNGHQHILIEGESGSGKSALVANWLTGIEDRFPDAVVHTHYLGATSDASDPVAMIRRLMEFIQRTTGTSDEIPGEPKKLFEALPLWLASASAWAQLKGRRFVVVLDSLTNLTSERDLRWFPRMLPPGVHMVASGLEGEVLECLRGKAPWERIAVPALDRRNAEEVFTAYLRRFQKELPAPLLARVMAHELVTNALFLRTLAEELRIFGVHEELDQRLSDYLASRTVDDLYERVLERVETQHGHEPVRKAMVGLWASRAGMREEEVQGYTGLAPLKWAGIRNALGEALQESNGRMVFGHQYMTIAVSDRYLGGNGQLEDESQTEAAIAMRRVAHADLAAWFEARSEEEGTVTARAAEEVPYQWYAACDWASLQATLTRRSMVEAFSDTRSDQELLYYWLGLMEHTGVDPEQAYGNAWEQWAPDESAEETGNLAADLSGFLQFAGRYKAITAKFARLALQIESRHYDSDSPQVGLRLNNLAGLLESKGDYAAAEPLYRRALAIAENALGADHPDTGTALYALGQLLLAQGRTLEAKPMLDREIALVRKSEGEVCESLAISLTNLGLALREAGLLAEADPYLSEALQLARTIYQEDPLEVARSLSALGQLRFLQQSYDEAAELFGECLTIRREHLPPDDERIALVEARLAEVAKGRQA